MDKKVINKFVDISKKIDIIGRRYNKPLTEVENKLDELEDQLKVLDQLVPKDPNQIVTTNLDKKNKKIKLKRVKDFIKYLE